MSRLTRTVGLSLAGTAALLSVTEPTLAQDAALDSGDTAWMLTATALVLFMTLPGLALFYGGLVRSRNVLSVLMDCFAIACVASVLWVIVGYTMAFGPDGNGFVGGFSNVMLAATRTAIMTFPNTPANASMASFWNRSSGKSRDSKLGTSHQAFDLPCFRLRHQPNAIAIS